MNANARAELLRQTALANGQQLPANPMLAAPQNPRFVQQQQPRIPLIRHQPAPPQQTQPQLFPPPRRPPPQPNPHITAMPPNAMNMSIQPHLRPPQQQPQQRIQPPITSLPDMAMVMARQNAVNQGIPQTLARAGSAMGSLAQPSQIPQVSFTQGMQPSHPQPNLQNSVQMPNQLPISSPRPGSHPQSMPTPGPSQTPVNRTRMTPENAINNTMFGMGFQNSQFPTNRVQNNGQFPFAPPSNSPVQISDVPQSIPASMINPAGGTPTRSGFQLTPAQQLEQMNENPFQPQFNMQPQRPPSQHNLHGPQPPPSFQPPSLHQQSPSQSDPLASHAQRPSSQPQQMIPGRPPSQPGRRTPQSSLGIPNMPGTRLPVTSAATQPPHPPIAPRPPQQPVPSQGPPSIPPSIPSTDSSANPVPVPPQSNLPQVGLGQGIQRLLQFSGILANESPKKLHLLWWDECIKEYFTPSAIMKITLWKDNQRTEAKPFEIGLPILPRFFLVTTQSGVKSMTLSLDGARERLYPRNPNHCIIECPSAVWTYRYNNGYTVTLRGPMTAHVVAISQPTLSSSDAASNFPGGQRHLKFENLQFDADQHDKFIMLDTVMSSRLSDSSLRKESALTANSIPIQFQDEGTKWEEPRIMIERCLIPGEPVNAFGIPQATMRCLELAESVGQMTDLIVYSVEKKLGPLEALKKFAAQLRESQSYGTFNSVLSSGNPASNPSNALTFITTVPPMSHGGTLYSSAPPSVVNPQANPGTAGSSIASPQNTPSSATNSPLKQHKTIVQQQQQQQQQQQSSQPGSTASSTAPATSPTISSGATNTPHMANSTLKRKQGPDAASPTISNADHQPQKRPQRKRRTAG